MPAGVSGSEAPEDDELGAKEPTVSIILSWVAIVASIAGLILAASNSGRPGMENLGSAVLMLAGLGFALLSSGLGMVAAGIGLWQAKRRLVKVLPLNIAFVLNLIIFWSVFVLPQMMR